jgi:hypothetical protein
VVLLFIKVDFLVGLAGLVGGVIGAGEYSDFAQREGDTSPRADGWS